jgi:UDP-2-acetamido-2-deoxy-ribo-hexuluronate aminotransferase
VVGAVVAIPLADVAADWAPIRAAVLNRIAAILEHGQFIMGPEVAELEAELGRRGGARNAIACSSGTMALQLALMALGVRPGHEVILPSFTFAAPLEAVLIVGARPVLVDVDPHTYTIDPGAVRDQITPKTRAVIGVSLYGHPADYGSLRALAEQHGFALIDDAAQSMGASLHGTPAGALADITCTSFFPTKPFGGIGDGGAVLCDDDELAARIRSVRDHGQTTKYVHTVLGTNGRLDTIACAALLEALPLLDANLARRNMLAGRYARALAPAAATGRLNLPTVASGATSTWAQYAVQVDRRDAIVESLRRAGVASAVHYPAALHHQPAFQDRVTAGSLTVSEALARRVLCVPLFPTLTEAQQDHVTNALSTALEKT